jgi:O-antigen/teichoic acid export membrane protein
LSIKKSISFTFGAQIINTLIAFVSSIIITRILGAGGRGEYAIFTNAIAFAVLFFGFSINSTIPYFINSGKAKAEELLTTIIIFSFISSLLVLGSLILLENVGKLYWVLPESITYFQYELVFTGIYLNTLLCGVLSTCLLTFKKFKEVSFYNVSFQVLPLLIYLLVYFKVIPSGNKSPFAVMVIVTAIISLLSILAIVLLFIKILPVRPIKKLIPFRLIKQFIFFSSMAYVGNVFQFFSYKLDLWIVNAYDGKTVLGIYSLAAQLSQLLWILPQSLANVLYSYASSYKEEEALRVTLVLKKAGFYGSLVLAIAGIILAYFFIPVLYGKEFTPAIRLMFIFLIGIIPFSIPTILAGFFAARGFFKFSFYVAITVSIATMCTYFIVIPKYGAVGGAVASVFSYLSSTVLFEYLMYRKYKINPFYSLKINKTIFSDIRKLIKQQTVTIS